MPLNLFSKFLITIETLDWVMEKCWPYELDFECLKDLKIFPYL